MIEDKRIIEDPKMKIVKDNLFVVRLPARFRIQEWTVRSCDRPSLSAVWSDGHKGVIGYKWNPVSISFFHPTETGLSKKIMDWIAYDMEWCKYRKSDDRDKNNVEIDMLDPTGAIIEKWVLEDCTIVSVNFGTCNYNKNRVSKTTMKLLPKNCRLVDMAS